jgi:catechol 2,3-dioxygenase-like lactoylglutathione lyase family enzyme
MSPGARLRHDQQDRLPAQKGAIMSDWDRQIGAMTLFVRDLDGTKAFYQQVFGLEPVFEEPGNAMFKFGDQYVFLHAADELPPTPGAVLAEGRKGAGQFAIIVEDVDAVCAELTAQGVEPLAALADRSWGMRTVTFSDPAGHVWEIAQEIAS